MLTLRFRMAAFRSQSSLSVLKSVNQNLTWDGLCPAQVDTMAWWKAVVKGEPEIDTQKVEPENSR